MVAANAKLASQAKYVNCTGVGHFRCDCAVPVKVIANVVQMKYVLVGSAQQHLETHTKFLSIPG